MESFILSIAFVIAITILFIGFILSIPPIFLLIILIGVIVLVYCIFANKRKKISIQDELSKIQYMDGHDFEYYCAKLLRKNGFSFVKVTQGSGDYGADILASYNGIKYVIQCKRYDKNVGVKAVQEVYSAKTHYRADAAAVLTNSYFTPSAQTLAYETGVELWNRNRLLDWILKASDNVYVQREMPYDGNLRTLKSFRFADPIQVIHSSPTLKPTIRVYNKKKRIHKKKFFVPIVLFVVFLSVFISSDSQPIIESEPEKQNKSIATPSEQEKIELPEITFSPTSPTNTHLVGNKLITPPVPTAFIVSESPNESYIGIMRKNANVRQYPDQNSNLIGSAKAGERIKIIEPFAEPKWHKVLFDEKEAYISANYCIIQNYDSKDIKE